MTKPSSRPERRGGEAESCAPAAVPLVRLNKLLATRGVASRRHVEEMIVAGRISVDGVVATEKGQKVRPDAVIEVDGRPVVSAPPLAWVALHKPRGYVSTKEDTHDRPIVMDLLPPELAHLHSVGRLDGDVSGLLLFTNDGALTHRLTHPRYGVLKLYRVVTGSRVTAAQVDALSKGVVLEDGPAAPARCQVLGREGAGSVCELAMHEGRKHEVKRLFEAVGNSVRRLERVAFGPVRLGQLPRGRWRHLTAQEVAQLYQAAGLPLPESRTE